MKTIYELHLLRFPVAAQDANGGQIATTVTATKDQLRAAGLSGQSSKELITRLCERRGLQVLEVGKASRRTVALDLDALFGGAAD